MAADTNGNGRGGGLAGISHRLIRALPPAFTVLVILNIFFMGGAVWMISRAADTRNILLTRIVEKCLLNGGTLR